MLSHYVLGWFVIHPLKKSFYITDPIVLLPYLECFDHWSRSWEKPVNLVKPRDPCDLEGLIS